MTAGCVALDKIESSTATNMALAIYARRVRDGVLVATVGKPLLKFLNYRLNHLNTLLRSGALNKLNKEQLTELAKLLKTLDTHLVRIVDDAQVKSYRFLRSDVERILENTDDLESILENICFAVDPKFHEAISSAIGELRIGVEESAALLR